MRTDVRPLTPEDSLEQAMETFVEFDVLALPVVNDAKDRRVIGVVRRAMLAGAYVRQLRDGGVKPPNL
jgi:CBS domain-containing protein